MDKIIKDISRDYMSKDKTYTDLNEIIEKCIYCMLTVEGMKNLNLLKQFQSQNHPDSMKRLLEIALKTNNSLKELPLYTELKTIEIPRYRSDILSALSSCDALDQYFTPKLKQGCSEDLFMVIMLLSTFHMRVIGKMPKNINWSLFMNEMSNRINQYMPLETILSFVDFLDSCVNFIDNPDAELLGAQFQFALLKNSNFEIKRRFSEFEQEQIELYNEQLPFEKIFKLTIENSIYYISNPSNPNFLLHLRIVLNVLQICVNVTSQKSVGRALATYLAMFPQPNNSYFSIIMNHKIPRNRYTRRSIGIYNRLYRNIIFWMSNGGSALDNFDRNNCQEFIESTGLDNPYIDVQYILDLLSGNLFIPRIVLSFLDFITYATTTFILFKETVALDIWEDIRLCLIQDNLAAGQISKCKISGNYGNIWVKTDLDTDEKTVLLLNVDGDVVREISFVKILQKNGNSYKIDFLSKSDDLNYNIIYVLDPAKNTYYSTLQNAVNLLKFSSNLQKTVLSQIWIGSENVSEVGRLQSSLEYKYLPDVINFGGCLTPDKFMQVCLDIKNIFGKSVTFSVESDIENSVKAKIPINSKLVDLQYSQYPLSCVDKDIKLTREQQLSVISSIFFPFSLIQGPPGTGKTQTMLSITRVLAANLGIVGFEEKNNKKVTKTGKSTQPNSNDERILICAHSNAALDQMLTELDKSDLDVFRFGRKATEEAKKLTVEGRVYSIVQNIIDLFQKHDMNEETDVVGDIVTFCKNLTYENIFDEIQECQEIENYADIVTSYGEEFDDETKTGLFQISKLLIFISQKRRDLVDYYTSEIGIIGCTVSFATLKVEMLSKLNIKTVIVEEAAKIVETEMISFLLLNPVRFILIGDQQQLSPVVKCDDVRLQGRFDMSFFERLLNSGIAPIQLTYQGRAKSEICNLYRNRYARELKDLKSVKKLREFECLDYNLQWIDVPIKRGGEMTNDAEAECICYVLQMLFENGVDLNDVSVITPYKNQKFNLIDYIQESSYVPRDICTVDEFQGLQNIIVILSLVSQSPSVWLRDARRINVSCSRSRSAFLIFGNMEGFRSTIEWESVVNIANAVTGGGGFLFANGRKISYDQMLLE
ncbi:hypothetical protein TVAG_038650 [Trichomonas vaginalis G3]|uniref:Uncharacterized protein n=1 Tax=Trichomonas vaginalis (strain ATCC PRA-98 / G3) TaxID=412133 RepID=A2DY21_TRIV3|nr:mRNA splicing, via spliceosome [Trichomonas vaginalis G3]EAY14757.1 hypothetical protein TVAG_038650 [Trichomonas vaginalis G3]KAI5487872.1 mRNA splicing, via spliceosome [Trichomonas vaginalis G3]|eukprot:XP_001326980.1 hypothetical protein [Trichomonas vaginalis G3]